MIKHIANASTLTNLKRIDSVAVSPNAMDITIDRVFHVEKDDFFIDENTKKHRSRVEYYPDENGYWMLPEGMYEVVCDNQISIGDNESAYVITRSTLNRNGLFITSGLYDSGYTGSLYMALYVTNGDAFIAKGTRIGQVVVFESEMVKHYAGDYGSGSAMETAMYSN